MHFYFSAYLVLSFIRLDCDAKHKLFKTHRYINNVSNSWLVKMGYEITHILSVFTYNIKLHVTYTIKLSLHKINEH
jgi:hypothetical protein